MTGIPFVLAQSIPSGPVDVLLLPAICVFFGAVIWIVGAMGHQKWRWWALLPLLIGLWVGGRFTLNIFNPFYRELFLGRKVIYSHYLASIMPIVGLLTIAVWHLMSRDRRF